MFVSYILSSYIFIVLDVLFSILLIHILRADVYGRFGMFLALSQTSLGRILKQVLQG
jgi:hypothetical protein